MRPNVVAAACCPVTAACMQQQCFTAPLSTVHAEMCGANGNHSEHRVCDSLVFFGAALLLHFEYATVFSPLWYRGRVSLGDIGF